MARKVQIATSRWLLHGSYTNGTVPMEHNENSKRDTFNGTEGVVFFLKFWWRSLDVYWITSLILSLNIK
jgi:hypothetical protein